MCNVHASQEYIVAADALIPDRRKQKSGCVVQRRKEKGDESQEVVFL
jgi:hypothetical protein